VDVLEDGVDCFGGAEEMGEIEVEVETLLVEVVLSTLVVEGVLSTLVVEGVVMIGCDVRTTLRTELQ
jgi:hypothetical protein